MYEKVDTIRGRQYGLEHDKYRSMVKYLFGGTLCLF